MIANVAPGSACYEETHNTLQFADRAKCIRTRATRNEVSVKYRVAEYAHVVHAMQADINALQSKLAAYEHAEADVTVVIERGILGGLRERLKRFQDECETVVREVADLQSLDEQMRRHSARSPRRLYTLMYTGKQVEELLASCEHNVRQTHECVLLQREVTAHLLKVERIRSNAVADKLLHENGILLQQLAAKTQQVDLLQQTLKGALVLRLNFQFEQANNSLRLMDHTRRFAYPTPSHRNII